MWSLLRNPLIRFLLRLWWIPAIPLLILLTGLGGHYGVRIMEWMVMIVGGFIAGVILTALISGLWKGQQLTLERNTFEQRFLCPKCLNFGPFAYGCGGCGNRVEPFVVHTGGTVVTTCGHCHKTLFTDEDGEGHQIKAQCRECNGCSDRSVHHNRAVRVLATLTSKDFVALSETTGIEMRWSHDKLGYAVHDDGLTLTVILNLGDLEHMLAPDSMSHALRHISEIWIDCGGVDPLSLGQTVDALIMKAEFPEERWRSVDICARQQSIDPASRHVLETRFGRVKYDMSPVEFIKAGLPRLRKTNEGRLAAKAAGSNKSYGDSL